MDSFLNVFEDRRIKLACVAGGTASLLWLLRPEPRWFDWPRQNKHATKGFSCIRSNAEPPVERHRQRGYQYFPPPFPNGWMFALPSSTLRKKDVLPLNLWGKDLVAFRGEDGSLALLGAYCPLTGTHIGYGGYVRGNTVICPRYGWAFNSDGVMENPPDESCNGNRPHLRKYPVVEKHGAVWAWMHAEGADPTPLWIIEPIEKRGLLPRCRTTLGTFAMHVQEPAHNSCDWYHFKTVHSTLGQHWFSPLKFIQPEIWSPPARCKIAKSNDDDGSKIVDDDKMITDQSMKQLVILGVKVPQWIVDRMMKVQVRFQGCMLGSISMKFPFIGEYYGIVQMTPQGVFNCHMEIWGFSEAWWCPLPIAWMLSIAQARTLFQDKEVWEQRTHTRTRNRVKGEYNWKQFDDWVMQCYSPNSLKWDDEDLRW